MKAFNCPQCGAALEFERIDAPLVKCRYCDSLVVVPAELRPAATATPPPPSPAREAPPAVYAGDASPKKIGLAAAALFLLAGVVALLIATNRPPDATSRVGAKTGDVRRLVPTPTPTPKPDGYSVAYTFGGEGTGPGLFQDGMSVATDAEGRVYVSDETRRVQRFDPSGQFLNTWNIPVETKWYSKLRGGPQKLLATTAGDLYAVMAGVVMKFDGETGEVHGAAHGSDYVHDAALDRIGRMLLVSQKGKDDELVMLGIDGRAAHRTHRFVSSLLDKQLEVEALRVATGEAGETYALYALGGVAGEHWYDDEDLAVFKFSPEGKYLMRFGSGGSRPGQFGVPSGVATDNRGRVYVCEPFDKIHVYESDGRYVRTLKTPHAVEAFHFDLQNNLYVAGGHKVSKLVLDR